MQETSIRDVLTALDSGYTTKDGACSVYEVGGSKAGEARLVVPREGDALLIDTGFAWSVPQTLNNIKACAGDHAVPWVVFSHSHYDHVDGLGYLMKQMPGLKVACAAHAAHVFTRPGAIKTMNDLEKAAAQRGGSDTYEPIVFPGKIDRILADGDVLHVGNVDFEVMETPGHTKDSLSFWCAKERLLIASETTGVYGGDVPSSWTNVPDHVHSVIDMQMLTGYQTTVDAIDRCRALHPYVLFCSHHPVPLIGKDADDYFISADYWAHRSYDLVKNGLDKGLSDEEILKQHKCIYQAPGLQVVQPEDAFDLNAGYTLATLKREITAA